MERLLKNGERQYGDGEIIFDLDDSCDCAFVVVGGEVELTQVEDDGRIQLTLLKKGNRFGDTDVSEQGRRGASAKAVGAVTLKVVPHGQGAGSRQKKPRTEPSAMNKLAQSLGGVNEMLVDPSAVRVPAADGDRPKAGLLRSLAELYSGSRSARLLFRVSPLSGEDGENQTRHLVAALQKRKGIKVRSLLKPLELDPGREAADQIPEATAAARKLLDKSGADLLIWGDVPAPGTTIYLRFVSAAADEEDRPGTFSPTAALSLPVGFGPEYFELFHAVCLAATVVRDEAKTSRLGNILPSALNAAAAIVRELPSDLTTREQAMIKMFYGNALAVMASLRGTAKLYQAAAKTYRSALEFLSRQETPLDWAYTQKHLGAVLQALSDRRAGTKIIDAAIDAFTSALKVFTKLDHPREWAATQNRLGLVLYKFHMRTGDSEALKHSLSAFQAALQIYSRQQTPLPWAEAMNNFSQAAQVFGEQMNNAEVLEKAVNACLASLEVRKKKNNPLVWAATQNTLGSALFLLGKQQGEAARLEGAAAAFENARDVFVSHGAERMTVITEKNLSHVEHLLAEHVPQGRAGTGAATTAPESPAKPRKKTSRIRNGGG